MTTATREDYIREMYKLSLKTAHIRSVELSDALGLAKSTVSERLRALAEEKLLTYEPYSTVSFTKKGKELGRKLTYKHRIIEVFLHDTLGFPVSKVHSEAHKLEHAFSDDAITRLAKVLGHPKTDPHGNTVQT
ncbi:MAG: metal-dependent transcriptional regulator [Nanoarchaeota archaeon]|nr:metal-dependent transcriptional regulator [Nanoarchaeota archaeon]